jgi:hypothetical protein
MRGNDVSLTIIELNSIIYVFSLSENIGI